MNRSNRNPSNPRRADLRLSSLAQPQRRLAIAAVDPVAGRPAGAMPESGAVAGRPAGAMPELAAATGVQRQSRLQRQAGVSLVTAIFLLVVLAMLAVAIVSVSGAHQIASALDVQGARAYQAARTGVEWGLYKQLRPSLQATCFSTSTFALPAASNLSGFTVTVQCNLTSGPGTLKRYQIISTACNQPGPACPNPLNNPDYVQRVVQVEF